jgi:hypothetical protein
MTALRWREITFLVGFADSLELLAAPCSALLGSSPVSVLTATSTIASLFSKPTQHFGEGRTSVAPSGWDHRSLLGFDLPIASGQSALIGPSFLFPLAESSPVHFKRF